MVLIVADKIAFSGYVPKITDTYGAMLIPISRFDKSTESNSDCFLWARSTLVNFNFWAETEIEINKWLKRCQKYNVQI